MYLSAERLAVVNRTVHETFEQTCVAWQVIPHWETGDPGQSQIRADDIANPAAKPLPLTPLREDFVVTLAQVIAPTADALLVQVTANIVKLAAQVDVAVVTALFLKAKAVQPPLAGKTSQDILTALISARADVEDAGYRAPSCLIVDTAGLQMLNVLDGGYPVTEALLTAANVNVLHRVTMNPAKPPAPRILLLGRRQRIAQGGAGTGSPGEEPVDLAVSVAPSLEVVGDTADGKIALAVRVTLATRVKDANALVAVSK